MPWMETDAMTERSRFVLAYETGVYPMAVLCRRFGVSRQTGYKWWRRYREGGIRALDDRSRRPKRSPNRTPERVESLIVGVRKKHPNWGPQLILDYLERHHPRLEFPAPSTAGEILKRHGMVKPRRRRRKVRHPGRPYLEVKSPNDVWPVDYKGQFKTRDGVYCYPLTISDSHSRFLLACRGRFSTSLREAKPVFIETFREYGLPLQILSDNGSPFASPGLGGLSRLAIWWIHLGIHPVRIEPGHPEQNPRHERMHRTLKGDTLPPKANMAAQQRSFVRFKKLYNQDRPHSSLNKQTPGEVYEPSTRPYPEKLPELEYPGHFQTRLISSSGVIKWHDHQIFLARPLAGERLGFDEIAEEVWSVFCGPVLVGHFDERKLKIHG